MTWYVDMVRGGAHLTIDMTLAWPTRRWTLVCARLCTYSGATTIGTPSKRLSSIASSFVSFRTVQSNSSNYWRQQTSCSKSA